MECSPRDTRSPTSNEEKDRSSWTPAAIQALVDARYAEDVLKGFRACKSSHDIRDVWTKFIMPRLNAVPGAENMATEQAQKKMSKLIATYREKHDQKLRTGSPPISWPYYALLDRYLKDSPATQPSALVDSALGCVISPPQNKKSRCRNAEIEEEMIQAIRVMADTGREIKDLLAKLVDRK